jgi:AcrR family transcriptional regulator
MYENNYWYTVRMSRSDSRLSRQKIALVAVSLADEEGFEAVSMRRIAQQLGVGTMSLYYYVKTKDELIAAMDDVLMGEALVPSLPRDWRSAMLDIAHHTLSMFLGHPWALVAMRSASPGLNAMRHTEQCLEALAETSLSAAQKVALLRTVDDFVFGHALRVAASDAEVDLEFAKAQIAAGAFPRMAEVFADGAIDPSRVRFERAIRALLDMALNVAD